MYVDVHLFVAELENKSTDTIITDEPDRIDKEETTGNTEGKETEEGDKIDSKDEGEQEGSDYKEATGNK